MSEILIKAEHVSKKFSRSLKRSLWYGMKDVMHSLNPFVHDTDRESDAFKQKELRPGEFWALQDINFEVRRGECLGLIGHNGAGKSTLLKILNGLIRPDAGRITMKGRVGALIELSAGFNPILTGRENIYTQAALLGFTKSEVDRKFDAIVDFSELEEFLEMPLQNYSSGMKVKLGFAVASQLEPDVLLVDEVLAVGDMGFRFKCLNRMAELLNRCAVIFVSHSMPQIFRACNHVAMLDYGKIKYLGADVAYGVQQYFERFAEQTESIAGTGEASLASISAEGRSASAKMGESLCIRYGEAISFKLELELDQTVKSGRVQLLFWNLELLPVMDVVAEGLAGFPFSCDDSQCVFVSAALPSVNLSGGKYNVSVIVLDEEDRVLCRHDNAISVIVTAASPSGANVLLQADWSLGRAECRSGVLNSSMVKSK